MEPGELKKAIEQLAEAKQLSKDSLWGAVESAFGAAYRREYAKPEQIIRARINQETGECSFFQTKTAVDADMLLKEDEVLPKRDSGDTRVRFNPEKHIMIEDARRVQQGVNVGDEIFFPLEAKTDFGRIAAQAARQAIMQRIHEAEREVALGEFEGKEDSIVSGKVQRIDRGNMFIDLGRTVAVLPFSEQIRGERFQQGDRIRAYVLAVDTSRRHGGFVRLSRTHPNFVVKLFEAEVPEMAQGVIQVRGIVREPGSRTKIVVESTDGAIDPVGALVGQRGVRVLTVKSELGGEQINIIEWAPEIEDFIAEAISPAEILDVEMDGEGQAVIKTAREQIPFAIGKGGQNLRLTAKLVDKDMKIVDTEGVAIATVTKDGMVDICTPLERDDEEETETPAEEVASAEEQVMGDDAPLERDLGSEAKEEVAAETEGNVAEAAEPEAAAESEAESQDESAAEPEAEVAKETEEEVKKQESSEEVATEN